MYIHAPRRPGRFSHPHLHHGGLLSRLDRTQLGVNKVNPQVFAGISWMRNRGRRMTGILQEQVQDLVECSGRQPARIREIPGTLRPGDDARDSKIDPAFAGTGGGTGA